MDIMDGKFIINEKKTKNFLFLDKDNKFGQRLIRQLHSFTSVLYTLFSKNVVF